MAIHWLGFYYYDNLWALIIPGALSLYNAIICKTAIEAIPESLTESAYIDGANDFVVLFKIITPLIKPTLAVLLLYYGVEHWNSWFNASIYISRNELLPIQNVLRAVLIADSNLLNEEAASKDIMYLSIPAEVFCQRRNDWSGYGIKYRRLNLRHPSVQHFFDGIMRGLCFRQTI